MYISGQEDEAVICSVKTLGITGISGSVVTAECYISNGLPGFDIISYSEFANKEYDTTKACYIDELESYMRFINQGTHIGGYTLSIE